MTETDLVSKLMEERDRARTLAALLEQELSEALETIETLNSKISGLTGKEKP